MSVWRTSWAAIDRIRRYVQDDRTRFDTDELLQTPRGLKSWAVLARVALAGRPVGRRELAGELFGEADDALGRPAGRWRICGVVRACPRCCAATP